MNELVNVWGNLAYIEGKDGEGNYINSLSPLNGSVGVRLEQPNWNINTALPVSYTHLDVYKRQPLHQAAYGVRHRHYLMEVGRPVLVRRRSDRDEDKLGKLHRPCRVCGCLLYTSRCV